MNLRNFLPVAISLVLLALLSALVPWPAVGSLLATFSLQSYIAMAGLGSAFYLIKAVRFWFMLRKTGVNEPLGEMMILYLASQPAALVPIGLAYRSVLLRQHNKVPIAKSGPTIVLQELIEGVVVLGLACLAALVFPSTRMPVIIVAVILCIALIGLRSGWLAKYSRQVSYLNKLPLINISRQRIRQFSEGNQTLLKPRLFASVGLMSLAAVLCGVAQMYVAGVSFDASLSFVEALMAYAASVIITAVTFLPGGLGISEQGSVGILVLSGISPAAAIAATIVFRVFNLGLGLALGFAAMALYRLRF